MSVLKISEAGVLAFHALVSLAGISGRTFSLKEIAGIHNASEAHLSKVMQRLVKAGFVKSIRGPKGGFMLNRDAEDISLREMYETFEGPLRANACLFNAPACSFNSCVFGTMLSGLDETVKNYLTEMKLSDVIQSNLKLGKV